MNKYTKYIYIYILVGARNPRQTRVRALHLCVTRTRARAQRTPYSYTLIYIHSEYADPAVVVSDRSPRARAHSHKRYPTTPRD